ncbi:MAG: hypothetical protein ACLRUN_14190 [Christensenellales bacterium]
MHRFQLDILLVSGAGFRADRAAGALFRGCLRNRSRQCSAAGKLAGGESSEDERASENRRTGAVNGYPCPAAFEAQAATNVCANSRALSCHDFARIKTPVTVRGSLEALRDGSRRMTFGRIIIRCDRRKGLQRLIIDC